MKDFLKSDLYQYILNDIEDYDGKIVFCKGKYCGGDNQCAGIFYIDSKDQPVLKVATKTTLPEEWIGALIHEYCHFIQWRDDCKEWRDFELKGLAFSEIIQTPKKYKKELLVLLNLELDCEKKVVSILGKKNLFLDKKKYVQTANAILYKYGFLYKEGKWPIINKNRFEKITELCNTKLFSDPLQYTDLPIKIKDFFKNKS
jgi:hypothetical protein